MAQRPTNGQTNWGTALNAHLDVALDGATGKVKPAGIQPGSTGQVLTTDASGVPTWGSAAGGVNYVDYDQIINQNITITAGTVVNFTPQDPNKTTYVGIDYEGGGAAGGSFISLLVGNYTYANVNLDARVATIQYDSTTGKWSANSSIIFSSIKFPPNQQFTLDFRHVGTTTPSGSMKVKLKWV